MRKINDQFSGIAVPTPAIPTHSQELTGKIARGAARVGVVGIGYVGLPLAVEKAKVGFSVVGFDRNPVRVDKINAGTNYIGDVADDELRSAVTAKLLRATTDFSELAACDVIVICVPTPLTRNREPDTSYIRAVGMEIAKVLRPGQLICLESTTYPGTTEELLLPLFAQSGLVVGEDYFLVFSPERVDPGNQRYTTKNTNKIVGGVTPVCLEVGSAFYRRTILNVLSVSSPRVAEMTKVFENTFRAVNIALVNEMALLCDRLKISIWEVIDAAATKPFGMMRFDPGPGVGGHCIPLDPFYLTWKAREYDFHTRFIELAGEINLSMPYFVREKVIRTLNEREIALRGSRIAVIGVAYKRDIDDWRESPAVKIMQLLERDGALVDYYDPLIPQFVDETGKQRSSITLEGTRLDQYDCTLILTDHSTIDWRAIVDLSRCVVDTRNVTKNVADPSGKVVML
jgi:UDP-N-acetyl-D-glucosamine dehydrogenase